MKIERITTAGILIEDGRYLVGKRAEGGAIGGEWEFPGGKNRWGESVADTLKREWKEELGVDIEVGKLVASVDFVNKITLYHLKACLVTLRPGQEFRLKFHQALRWVTAGELRDLPMAPSDREVARQILAAGQART